MDVAQYIFTSPSPNQVQVGRLATGSSGDTSTQANTSELTKLSQVSVKNPVNSQEVKPAVKSDSVLDLYV